MLTYFILLITFSLDVCAYNIGDYGWKPYSRGGLGFTNFGGGTDEPYYQYEPTFKRSCGLFCTQYAKASDFGTLDSRHLHPDPEAGANRNPDWD